MFFKRIRLSALSVRAWILIVIGALVCVAIYYELVCHYTPFTSDAYLQAYVVQIAPQVEGWVTEVNVSNNSPVRKGDKLFKIDPRPYRFEVNRLKARVVSTRRDVKRLERERDQYKALIAQRQAEVGFSQEDYSKINALEEEGAYAQIRRDKALAVLNAKKAMLDKAKQQLAEVEEALEARIGGENAIVRVAEAALAKAEFDLNHTTVNAPADGYVANLQLSVGSYVKIGDPVVTMIDTGRWWVVAHFKENALARIRKGQSAEMALPMYPGHVFNGSVLGTDWGVKVGQGLPSGILPEVHNPKEWVKPVQRFPVRLDLKCSEEDYPRRVGASVTVVIFTEQCALFNGLSRLWLWIGSYLNFLY